MKLFIVLVLLVSLISASKQRYQDEDEDHYVFKKSHHRQTAQDDPSYAKLEQIWDHPLGAKILQTIALQMRSSDNLGAVSKLLNDLRTDLEAKQVDSDTERTIIRSQCKSDLQSYGQRVSLSIGDIKDAEFKAKRLGEAVGLYNNEIAVKDSQIKQFQIKDTSLRSIRVQDSLDFSSRTEQMKEMVQAFQVLLPKLHLVYDAATENPQKSFIEEESVNDALIQLSKIGSKNPITSMVALTSSLEPGTVQTLIEKLEEIRDSINESIQFENDQEIKHQRETDVILGQIFTAIDNLTREKASDEEALQETIRNRDIQDKRARDAHAEFTAAKNGQAQRQSQCDEYQVQYEGNTIERQKQITIIKDVQNIIATKLEIVSSFIEENNLI